MQISCRLLASEKTDNLGTQTQQLRNFLFHTKFSFSLLTLCQDFKEVDLFLSVIRVQILSVLESERKTATLNDFTKSKLSPAADKN